MSENSEKLKILFFGDIVGKLGRKAVGEYLSELKAHKQQCDFVIANVENASHGFGLTEKNYNEISASGVDCMTSGNHIWDKKDIHQYIQKADKLIRPINYPAKTKGKGSEIFEVNGVKFGVINALGRVFMNPVESQWVIVKKEIKKIQKVTPIVIIDFHAEATAEKICFGRYCSELGVSAFFGTHTHVQTADEKIINNMAYITDAGFCGVKDSVIGMEYETSLKRLSTSLPERFEVPESKLIQLNAVEVTIDKKSGKACDIKRIYVEKDYSKEEA
jgi:metallophosphoesterase (TIGR00282 family)